MPEDLRDLHLDSAACPERRLSIGFVVFLKANVVPDGVRREAPDKIDLAAALGKRLWSELRHNNLVRMTSRTDWARSGFTQFMMRRACCNQATSPPLGSSINCVVKAVKASASGG